MLEATTSAIDDEVTVKMCLSCDKPKCTNCVENRRVYKYSKKRKNAKYHRDKVVS